MPRCSAALASAILILVAAGAAAAPDGEALYTEHCALCHGPDRLGLQGPALIPESLRRLKKPAAERVIRNGRPSTQMPAFASSLDAEQTTALIAYIYTPLPKVPVWSAAQIAESRILTPVSTPDDGRPVFTADPLNLFVVVESGDHHVTLLDGDTFELIYRFPSRFALHGGPKFTPDGRFVYFGSRDGWVTKFDIYKLAVVAEVRAGINTRNIALSSDGRFVAVANYLPHTLVILDADDLSVRRILDVEDRNGENTSRVSAVYQAAPRKSFIAALKDVPEVWEIATDESAKPVHTGLVHSHEKGMEEALPSEAGLFALRRIIVDEPIDDFFFDQSYRHLVGSSRKGNAGVVVNLNVGREIARIDLSGFPHLGSGITWTWQGRSVFATPHLREGMVSVIDMDDWRVVKSLKTGGPGFFMRSHENTSYAWVDVFFGPNRDQLHVIDKESLEIVRTLRPEPGKTAAHVEFTKDGRHALVSIWEDDGAIVVYDAQTLEEVKRIPMRKPSGKYNVHNKITLSAGTSH